MKYAIKTTCIHEAQKVLEKMEKDHPDWRWGVYAPSFFIPSNGMEYISFSKNVIFEQREYFEKHNYTIITAQEYLNGKLDEPKNRLRSCGVKYCKGLAQYDSLFCTGHQSTPPTIEELEYTDEFCDLLNYNRAGAICLIVEKLNEVIRVINKR